MMSYNRFSSRIGGSPQFWVWRETSLEAALRAMFAEDFAGRVLPVDSAATPAYAELVAARRAGGRRSEREIGRDDQRGGAPHGKFIGPGAAEHATRRATGG